MTPDSQNLRFRTFTDGRAGHFIVDEIEHGRILAHSFSAPDAQFITVKLNETMLVDANWRGLIASVICSFRQKLEQDNNGPLTNEPTLAYFLDDFCDHLNFNTGERALALGPHLLVYLNQLQNTPPTRIQVVNSESDNSSIVPVRDLVMGEELRVE